MRLRGSFRHARSIIGVLLLVCLLLPAGASLAEINFVNPQFQAKWQRADKPVQDNTAKPARSWLWGPEGFNQSGSMTEPYAQSPGGTRQVQYFDKARMELNNPSSGLVTNGLLVRELISGKLATGDATDIVRKPAGDIPVAGDAVGNDGPTYASLQGLASLNLDNPSPDRTGQNVIDTLDKAGKTGTAPQLGSKAKYVYFDNTLKHNIPDVFWNFMNQKGSVFENGKLVEDQPVLGSNPAAPWLDATGYPLSEAYWTRVTVGGQVKDVLMQAFERRVLTFTPDNSAQYQVEMGNVGRHYFTWRYSASYDIPATPPPTTTPPTTTPPTTVTSCDKLPVSTANTYFHCGPAGMQVLIAAQLTPSEAVTITPNDPDGNKREVFNTSTAPSGEVKVIVDTLPDYKTGMWTYNIKGLSSGKEAVLYEWVDPPVTKPTIFIAPNPAKKTDEVYFQVVGFLPREFVTLTLRCPCALAANAIGDHRIGFGGGFLDNIKISRDVQPPKFQYPGEWIYSVLSKDDGSRWAAAPFTITD